MTPSGPILGKLIDDFAGANRDAIHIAVAPVHVAEEIEPGSPVGLCGVDRRSVKASPWSKAVGILDPFLQAAARRGQHAWMLLLPNTITSLRHEWTHWAFGRPVQATPEYEESRLWIVAFAHRISETYDSVMAAATRWYNRKESTISPDWGFSAVQISAWPEFWRHYFVVANVPPRPEWTSGEDFRFYTCPC